jgi:hypothetical protein
VTSRATYRLDNAAIMVGLAMPAVSDAILAEVGEIVVAEQRRRAAAGAAA